MSLIRLGHVMVIYNTNATLRTLSEQVADYYITAHGLNSAHKYGVDMGNSKTTTNWSTAQCYSNFIEPIATYIQNNDIDCVLMSANTPSMQDVGGTQRSVAALAGHSLWLKSLGHMVSLDSYKFSHMSATAADVAATSCTITQASPALVTYVDGAITSGSIVTLATNGELPAPLEAGKQYYVVNANVPAKTCNLSETLGGSGINTTSAGSGTHTIKLDTVKSALDINEVAEQYGTPYSARHYTKSYDWRGNSYWRPNGRIGYLWGTVEEDYVTIKRIIDDAIASEGIVRAPIHIHHYDRSTGNPGYITGLQCERARLLLNQHGIETRHNATHRLDGSTGPQTHTLNPSWPDLPPEDSYGVWTSGEFSAAPFPVGGMITPSLVNVTANQPWLNSFAPVRGAWIINPTSGPTTVVREFILKGGCAGFAIQNGEPLADNVPNVHTFTERLMDGMTFCEAAILSTPTGGYKEVAIGDPLYRPLKGLKKSPRSLHGGLEL